MVPKPEVCATKSRYFKHFWKKEPNFFFFLNQTKITALQRCCRGTQRCSVVNQRCFRKAERWNCAVQRWLLEMNCFRFQRCWELNQRCSENFSKWIPLKQTWSSSELELISAECIWNGSPRNAIQGWSQLEDLPLSIFSAIAQFQRESTLNYLIFKRYLSFYFSTHPEVFIDLKSYLVEVIPSSLMSWT